MQITEAAWSDRDAMRRLVEVTNAVRRVDAPWMHPMTERECVGDLRHSWEGEPGLAFLASVDGVDVGWSRYDTSEYDNQHVAWLEIEVVPEQRRRGHGSALLKHLLARAGDEGRRTVSVPGWAGAVPGEFTTRHGLVQKAVEVNRRQYLADLDRDALDRMYADALPHASDYELLRWPPPTAEADLDRVAAMVAAINDAPTDDLDREDEVFTPARILAYEAAQAGRDRRLYRVVARHRGTGELAGQSVVAVDGERPHLSEQHDTSVVRAHRGHRLGVLLKLEVLRWLAEAEPQLAEIDTWNAESNDRMIGVNEALGYRVMGRLLAFERPV